MTPEEQKDILAKRVATRKVRCKNWPNCKDPNCIYAHPTETVSINIYYIFFSNYSVHIFLLVCMEINVVIYIRIFLVNMDIIVLELDVPIRILQELIRGWECFLI